MQTPTPHIEAKPGDVAETVLMPGDPLRAKFIAETFLTNAKQYNGVRGMLGYTGTYKNKRISVQGSGMGIPSIGIYSYELFSFYDVQNIMRIGTTGSLQDDLHIKDIVIAQAACTDSNFMAQYGLPGSYAPIASYPLLSAAVQAAKEKGVAYRVGNVLSSDLFYSANAEGLGKWKRMGVLAVEMESAGLYANAAFLGKNALCLLTVSDCIFTGEATTAAQRQTAFTDMMEIALETALRI